MIRFSFRKAFTIVEVMVAGAISALIMIGIMVMLVASQRMTTHVALHNRVEEEARRVSDTLTSDVRGANSVEATFTDSTSKVFTESSTTLILKLPSINAQGKSSNLATEFDRIIYDSSDGQTLIRRIRAHANSERDNEDNVLGFGANPNINVAGTFLIKPDALGAFVINFQFTGTQELGDKQFVSPVAGSVRLRNKL